MNWFPLFRLALVGALLPATMIACGGDDDDEAAVAPANPTRAASPTAVPLEGEILVFGASSLTEAFKEAGPAFQAANPRTKVRFNFASSSALATQINEGAPADVFASADTNQMKVVTDKGNALESKLFAKNTPVVVVLKSSTTVVQFSDLSKPGVKLVIAGKDVPIGRYAREIFLKATGASAISDDFSEKVLANVKSEEANVRGVLTKVQLGEADAGIVYVTDIGAAANDVRQVEIPTAYNVVAEYPIAVVKASKHQDVATAFVNFVVSDAGQAILKKYGFTTIR